MYDTYAVFVNTRVDRKDRTRRKENGKPRRDAAVTHAPRPNMMHP